MNDALRNEPPASPSRRRFVRDAALRPAAAAVAGASRQPAESSLGASR